MLKQLKNLFLLMLNGSLAYAAAYDIWKCIENRYFQDGFYYSLLKSLPVFFADGFLRAAEFTALFFPAAFFIHKLTMKKEISFAGSALFSLSISAWIYLVFLFGYLDLNNSVDFGYFEKFGLVGVVCMSVSLTVAFMLLKNRHRLRNVLQASLAAASFRLTAVLGAIVLIGAALSFAVSPRLRKAADRNKPSIIFILIDALRADHMGLYGYERPTTPFLDAWSKKAVVFRNAYSAESYTLASVSSIFTSLYPVTHQALYLQPLIDSLSEKYVTIPEVLQNRGYVTAGILHQPGLRMLNIDQAYDYYYNKPPEADPGDPAYVRHEKVKKINRLALDWLDTDPGRPFFMYLHYMDVHHPYVAPPLYSSVFHDSEGCGDCVYLKEKDYSPEDTSYLISQYDAEILYVDTEMEKFFNALEGRGIMENTIVIFTADHGEEFKERHPDDPGGFAHGRRLYEEQVRVPLIIGVPGLHGDGRAVMTPVSLVDLFPTILELAGVDYEGAFQGKSLVPLMTGEAPEEPRPVFAGGNHDRGMVIYDGWKYYARTDYTRFVNFELNPYRRTGLPEDAQLFDLREDPLEQVNLIEKEKARTVYLRKLLEEWYEHGDLESFRPEQVAPDEETREELRALGYLR